jgi:hypothetical protein
MDATHGGGIIHPTVLTGVIVRGGDVGKAHKTPAPVVPTQEVNLPQTEGAVAIVEEIDFPARGGQGGIGRRGHGVNRP